MSEKLYIKCLSAGGFSPHSWLDEKGNRSKWDLPVGGQFGAWKLAHTTNIAPHKTGLHVVQAEDLIYFFTGHNFKVELDEKIVDGYDCTVAYKARLLEKIEISDIQFQNLALQFAESAQEILTLLEYPNEFRLLPINAYHSVERALKSNGNRAEALKLLRTTGAQQARHHLDSYNTAEYVHSAKAAEYSHKAIVDLGGYLLKDENDNALYPDMTKGPAWQIAKLVAGDTAFAWQEAAAQFNYRTQTENWFHDSALKNRLMALPVNPKAEKSKDFSFQVFSSFRMMQNNMLLKEIGLEQYCTRSKKTLADWHLSPK